MILRGHFFRVIAVHIQYTSIINELQPFYGQPQSSYAV